LSGPARIVTAMVATLLQPVWVAGVFMALAGGDGADDQP
jgi:hypothetical protein